MKNLFVVVVILAIFFSLFIYVGTHTPVLKDTPFYWVAKDLGSLFGGFVGAITKSVTDVAYPTLTKMHLIKR